MERSHLDPGPEPGAPRFSRCFWCARSHPAAQPLSVCAACVAALRERSFALATLGMKGAYPLDAETIDEVVCRTSPGNFALGYMDHLSFRVFFVGRCDSDVRSRLHRWVGMPSRYERYAPPTRAAWGFQPRAGFRRGAPVLGRVGSAAESGYTRFAYSYARSAEAALERQRRNYDDFGGTGGLDNVGPPTATDRASPGRGEDAGAGVAVRRVSRSRF